jgi:nucleoside-diphosphate-sugar epimerase
MRILVTGAAGFVGSNLSKRLLASGHEVKGIDSLTDYYEIERKHANLEPLISDPSFTFIEGDLNDLDLREFVPQAEIVFHQAGQPGVRKSWGKDFSVYLQDNVQATQRLLEAAVGSDSLKRFVYASSSSVYGNAERYPTKESDLPKPLSPYGVSKLAAEHLCVLYARNFAVPTVSLRYFTVYGPGQRTDMAFTRFVRAAVRGEEIVIYGDGHQIRDFTFIDDVVKANVLAGTTTGVEPGRVYNVAGGSNTSVREVLSYLEDLHGAPLNIRYTSKVAGDVFRTGGDTHLISSELGWSPEVSLHDGLRRQYEWATSAFAVSA